jgi:hypothetical protein
MDFSDPEDTGTIGLESLLAEPKTDHPPEPIWTLRPRDKRVLREWKRLSRDTPANIINAYEWLSQRAMTLRGTRCFPLKGKKYAGCWCYELGPGDRLYYKPDEKTKTAVVWYVGAHPKDGIPAPPEDF